MYPRPRFVMTVGHYSEPYPDMPEDPPFGIYDRELKAMVLTIHEPYWKMVCLETTRTPLDAPFTNLENWMNEVSAEALQSEGIPA